MLINLIALIISVSALHVSAHSDISFSKDGTDQLSSLPLLDMEPIRNPTNNRNHEVEIVTQNSTKLDTYLEAFTNQTIDFIHYLPVYSLYRAKSYFLLI